MPSHPLSASPSAHNCAKVERLSHHITPLYEHALSDVNKSARTTVERERNRRHMHSQVHSFIAGSPPSKREFPRDRATIDRIEAECLGAGRRSDFLRQGQRTSFRALTIYLKGFGFGDSRREHRFRSSSQRAGGRC